MIQYIDNFNLIPKLDCQILFNPVSASDTVYGRVIYNTTVKDKYRKAYNRYREYVKNNDFIKTFGKMQLVRVKDLFIIHGYVYRNNILDHMELADILTELYNIAQKQKLNIAIPLDMGLTKQEDINKVNKIIETIFKDGDFTTYVFNKYNMIHLRHSD